MHTAHIVAITHPEIVGMPDMTASGFIAYAARVSNPANQSNALTAPRLLRYLIEHRHWSPFEMVHVVMEIETTRDIGRQILRHRSFSFQEFSQRYAVVDAAPYTGRELRTQAASNRQASVPSDDAQLTALWERLQRDVTRVTEDAYSQAIEAGVAREQARALLAEGLTTTRMYMAGSLRSWIHYIDVRNTPDTQHEHRLIALAAQREIMNRVPELSAYWKI